MQHGPGAALLSPEVSPSAISSVRISRLGPGHLPYPRLELRCVQRARLSLDFTALFEDDQSRYAAHTETRRQMWVGFGIKLRQSHLRFQYFRRLRKYRCKHLTRPTPGCPKIDNDRNVGVVDHLFKILRREFDRPAREQGIAAFPTHRSKRRLIARHTIDNEATRTADV